MAVNSIIFGGVNSADYGIYISGEGVFNAPKRDVEMISIPGRNGAFALDKGRFENIEVTYPAFNFEPMDYATFAQNLSDFRNAISSLRGYQRLTDTFHPDEYRMATYISGLEVKPIKYNTASEFNIIFDCKPQRYLTSGEEAVTMGSWGDTDTTEGAIVTIDNADGGLGFKSVIADIEPIQSGSGTPSPSNIRPISGYDSVVVSRTGKNLCQFSVDTLLNSQNCSVTYTASGVTVTASGTYARSGYTFAVTTGQKYTISLTGTANGNLSQIYVSNSATWSNTYGGVTLSSTSQNWSKTITATSDTLFIGCYLTSTGTTGTMTITNFQVELGQTATTYEPYNGNTYTISLNGTRYGGTLDVTTGVLTVTKAIVDLGTLTWNYSGDSQNHRFSAEMPSDYKLPSSTTDRANVICSSYASNPSVVANVNELGISGYQNSNTIYVRDLAYTDATTFKTAMNGVQCVYPLATPQTVSLTAQEITALQGVNHVWANSGDITVEYGADPHKLVNPTLFDSSPLLEIDGYGNINLNGSPISIEYASLGNITLWDRGWINVTPTGDPVLRGWTFPREEVNTGDSLRFGLNSDISSLAQNMASFYIADGYAYKSGWSTPTGSGTLPIKSTNVNGIGSPINEMRMLITPAEVDFVVGTSANYSYALTLSGNTLNISTQTQASYQIRFTLKVEYDGNNTIKLTGTRTIVSDAAGVISLKIGQERGYQFGRNKLEATSTVLAFGNPTYIDCDLGEAYMIKNGEVVSLNSHIALGSELPSLSPGANQIIFDNTITELKIVPRWWKV